jgi:hypothetical protein
MKNLILENDCEQDIPEELMELIENESIFSDGQEFWTQFKESFWPENREETMRRFMELNEDDNVLCQTVFVDWMQLELVVELLCKLKSIGKKINFHILVYPSLEEQIKEYLDEYESDITPDTDEYDDSPSLRTQFKKEMNQKLLEAIEYHNIYDLIELYHYGNNKKLTPEMFK